MKTTRDLTRLGQPVFIFALIMLILNDWVFKAVFHNFITGKLSDFAGLFAFPFFWSVLFPKRIKEIHLGTLLFFVFWKSSFSEPFVQFIGGFRTVDFTDNIALISIFFSYRSVQKEASVLNLSRVHLSLILLVSCFSFVATTQERRFDDINEYIYMVVDNQTDQNIMVLIDFKYSEKEIATYKKRQISQSIMQIKDVYADDKTFVFKKSDSVAVIKTVNDQWDTIKKNSIIKPLVLKSREATSVELPLLYYDHLMGFPESFKITILDQNKKTLKTYNKKAFFEKMNQNASVKVDEYSREDAFNFVFGEIKKPFILSHCFGKWESKTKGDFSNIEFNSKYFSNDITGDVYDCQYKTDTILVYTPGKVHIGILKKPEEDLLTISWDTKTTLKYKRSSKPTSLGSQ